MNDDSGKGGLSLIPLLFKNPILGLAFLIIVLIVGTVALSFMTAQGMNDGGGITDESKETVYVNCTSGELNKEVFYSQFEDAGVFSGMGAFFLQVSSKNQIDPVILSSIAFHETGRGTSKAVKNKNNPGGLMSPKTGSLMVFDSLEEGIDAMASNLYRLYISQGLVTIPMIGSKYAPIGVDNDPNNLNINWVPTVSSLANEFGGLSMNCEQANMGSGEFFKPIPNITINSNFGYRSDPFTGAKTFHKGIDFACQKGDPIYSALSGKVVVAVKSGYGGGYGLHVVLQHGDKLTLYAHMSKVNVNVGDTIGQAQILGACGSTGNSTGPHLHFEVQLSLYGQRIDPTPFF